MILGGGIICKNKATFDKEFARSFFEERMKMNYYKFAREWPYKYIKPRIIAEKYMEDDVDEELRDYKFYCFNGKPTYLLLATNRQNKEIGVRFDYFDMNFNHLDLHNYWHPNNDTTPHKPLKFEEMKDIAARLSANIPQVRVDLYEVNGDVYFGEMTFFDMGGYLKIYPENWDMEWGNLIKLR